MDCQDCPRYDHGSESCRDRKLNPRRWDQAVDVANVYGLRAICTFNDHREKLLASRATDLRQDPTPSPAVGEQRGQVP